MHEVLFNRLGGLSLPRKSVVRLTDRPDMTLDVYRGRKTTMQQCNNLTGVSYGQSYATDYRFINNESATLISVPSSYFKSFLPGNPYKDQRQTVQTQSRRHFM